MVCCFFDRGGFLSCSLRVPSPDESAMATLPFHLSKQPAATFTFDRDEHYPFEWWHDGENLRYPASWNLERDAFVDTRQVMLHSENSSCLGF